MASDRSNEQAEAADDGGGTEPLFGVEASAVEFIDQCSRRGDDGGDTDGGLPQDRRRPSATRALHCWKRSCGPSAISTARARIAFVASG